MRMALSPCNPKMIVSAFTTIDMSSSLRDCQPSQEGPEGQRGQGHHEREGTQAGVCDSPDDGAAVDAGEGGRPWARASWTGEAVEPADCGVGQGDCAEAVRVAVWGFLADVGSREAGRAPWDHAQRGDCAGLVTGRRLAHFARRKRPHRTWRERKAHAGELLQLDGSHHDWLEGRGPRCVLMAYIDDASSRVYAQFYEYEGTIPAMDSFTRYVRGMEFPSRSMRIGIRPISRSPRRRWRSSWRVGSPRVSLGGRWTNWGAS